MAYIEKVFKKEIAHGKSKRIGRFAFGLGSPRNTCGTYQRKELASCLQKDVFNIKLAARHLKQLVDHDAVQSYPVLSKEQIQLAGARYNRGIGLSLAEIKKNTSYGDFIVRNLPRFIELLK